MQISQKFTGQDAENQTMWADGMFNNKNIYTAAEAGGWGCVNDATPEEVSTCHSSAGGYPQHDWWVVICFFVQFWTETKN